MSNSDVAIQKLIRRVERFAGRLNPGLAAVALILSSFLLAEISLRYSVFYADQAETAGLILTADPTALLPIEMPPSQ